LSICLPLRARGLRLVYDPAIVVHHHPAPRAAGEQRTDTGDAAIRDASHNEALEILDHVSAPRRLVFAAWSVAVGPTQAPGLVPAGRQTLAGVPGARSRFAAAQAGRAAAWRTRRTPRAPLAAATRLTVLKVADVERDPGAGVAGYMLRSGAAL